MSAAIPPDSGLTMGTYCGKQSENHTKYRQALLVSVFIYTGTFNGCFLSLGICLMENDDFTGVNPLPDDKILDRSKLKQIAADSSCEKRRNCLLQAISLFFSHNVFHSYISLVRQKVALC